MVLSGDYGGSIPAYVERYASLPGHSEVAIDGPCASACTLFWVRSDLKVCITSRARLGFHQSSSLVTTSWLKAQYPAWAVRWIDAHGGLTHHVVWMEFDELRQHLPLCDSLPEESASFASPDEPPAVASPAEMSEAGGKQPIKSFLDAVVRTITGGSASATAAPSIPPATTGSDTGNTADGLKFNEMWHYDEDAGRQ
jgi:hypothetical protein